MTAPKTPPAPLSPAGGLTAVLSSLSYARDRAGVGRALRALSLLNQDRGFDCPSCAWPDPAPGERSLAEFCENGARAVAHEADRRRLDAGFFAEHSRSSLRAESDYFLEQQGRLVEPVFRAPGDDHYRPLSYGDAFALAGTALRELASADRAIFYTSGRASNEAAFLYQLLARALGTNNLPDCSNLCHESSGKGLGTTIGVGKGTVGLADFELADCIFIIGQNPGTNHPRMLTTLAAARQRGATLVSINPLRERALVSFAHPQTARGLLGSADPISTEYVQVRINGDVALLKGVMKELLRFEAEQGGVLDHEFIREHTRGFEAFAAALAEIPLSRLVKESGVSQAEITRLAEIYRQSRRVIVCWAMGLTQHKNGVANVRELVNFLLLRGNLGRPGAGVCPVRGHSNVQGDRTVGIVEAPSEAFLDRLERALGFQVPRRHGHDAVGSVLAMERGEVDMFVALGGNFVRAMSDSERTAAAIARTKLAVHVATKLNRTHLEAGSASLILPCLGRSERDAAGGRFQFVSVEDSMGVVHRSEGALEPPAPGLLGEPAIVAGIAGAALGRGTPVPWDELARNYDAIRALIERAIPGFERYNQRVREPGGFELPNAARERRFATDSGKAEFTVQALPEHELGQGQLLLTTVRSHDQFNTTIYGLDDRYRGIRGDRRVVFLNAEDMAERRLEPGQRVDLTSHFRGSRRSVYGFTAVPYDLPRGSAAGYFPELNPLVALESHADESHTPTSKSIVVTLAPSTGASAPGPAAGSEQHSAHAEST
jgi:molybdopterin-dependent oxidoreductase alpha subunit